jgi:hypothetical protein
VQFVINCVELTYFKHILIGIQKKRSLDFNAIISLIKVKYPDNNDIIKLIEDCKPKLIDTTNALQTTLNTPKQLNENFIDSTFRQSTPTQATLYNNFAYQQQEEASFEAPFPCYVTRRN